jgi:hypothetical protein
MARLLLLTLCLLALPSCLSRAAASEPGLPPVTSSDEHAEREAILQKIKAAIASSDFAGLSAMEDDFRSSRARTPSGTWKLAVFHSGMQAYLADGLQSEHACQYQRQPFVRQWAAAAPRNPAPAITDAALLLEQAWCIRGTGFADSVASEAWPKFHDGVDAAFEILKKHKSTASIDPEFYAVELDAARAQGVSKAAFHDIIEEAVGREPNYHRTYYNAAWFYLPQWSGSYEEVEGFARYATDKAHLSEHSGLYARIFIDLDDCDCHLIQKVADWPTMKQSMRDIYDQYPVRWHAEYFADLSCRMGDAEEGRRYIRAMHPEATDEISFSALFNACDKRAETGS